MSTVVALHAHPDDETLLTGGTLAAAAARGDRVVVVTATDGGEGLTRGSAGRVLAAHRARELEAAASALGVHEVVHLGHTDSGSVGTPAPGSFATLDPDRVADEVVAVIDRVGADVLIGYDAHGGYGHPDHRQVHRVARIAAARTGVRLLEATVDRDRLVQVARVLAHVPGLRRLVPASGFTDAFTPGAEIGLRVDVRDQVRRKQQALRAHASQERGGIRTVAVLGRMPRPLARRVLGTEWFLTPGDPAT